MENAKEYLKQVDKLNAQIKNKLVERSQWKDIALGITTTVSCERVQSSSSKKKMSEAIDRCIDIEREINDSVDSLINLKGEIIQIIEQLNSTEYDVLHKRYIQGMTFDEIGASKGRSKSWATTVHGRALKSVQRILDKREKNM